MKPKAIIYDCVGPLLLKNTQSQRNPIVAQIDERCGSVIDEMTFWQKIQTQHHWSTETLAEIQQELAESYGKNKPMWEFHRQIRLTHQTAIINNGTSAIFSLWTRKYQLNQWFDQLFNSAQLGVRKPDPQIFIYVTQQLQREPQDCLFIDDSAENVAGAESIGMTGILYQPNEHADFLQKMSQFL